ncbi:MAG: winged helix-turn-helix domain-containing protein [bacterium]
MNTTVEKNGFLIGEFAGRIWSYLSKVEKADAIEIKSRLGLTSSQLFLAIGWLSRENKIDFWKEKGVYYFKLINK